ncbi:MAG: glycosyltransferase family A protein [Clostridium sp.]|uniref:glycosyltransferase family 2 protein n=1 Tax=Clostridium sp. TaxID=1506 RepID=UPI003069E0FF
MKPLLTIFTPTYNRQDLLARCYESYKRQISDDFIWMIIDDGSTDNTSGLVDDWIKEDKVRIKYIYQENQGMHGAHNTAYENIDTELNTCIDSDDYMPEDGVEKICSFWRVNGSDKYAGIAALDAFENGQVIGTKFPQRLTTSTVFGMYHKEGIVGDKKLIYRSDLTRKYPYPIFQGERYVGLAYKYYKLDQEYEVLLMNEVVCIVEYQEDGSSMNMLRQYKRNPRGFAFYRIENMKNPMGSLKYRFKECIHYTSSSLMSRNKKFLKETPCKLLTFLAIPFGVALYFYINKKVSII